MKKNQSAFTLIELLVVITIIAILASIALPVFNGVTERANQTKDLSNAKQIGLAAKLFAADNNGAFPSKAPGADYATATALATGGVSNDAFWWLFPNYLTTEDIFVVNGSAWGTGDDNKIDPAGSASRTETLKTGENTYAYVSGLTDTANAAFPLIADGFTSGGIGQYSATKSTKGGVWAGKKAVVIFCDTSGQIMKTTTSGTNIFIVRPGHAPDNMFATGTSQTTDPWLDLTTDPVLNPQ